MKPESAWERSERVLFENHTADYLQGYRDALRHVHGIFKGSDDWVAGILMRTLAERQNRIAKAIRNRK